MNAAAPTLRETIVKTMVAHTVTYFLVGALAFFTLAYAKTVYTDPSVAASSRPPTDPLVMAGPLFQPIRGILFGVVFYLLRDAFFRRPRRCSSKEGGVCWAPPRLRPLQGLLV